MCSADCDCASCALRETGGCPKCPHGGLPTPVGHGRRGKELILVLPKRNESASDAMARVSARHPGVSFKRGRPTGGLPSGVLDLIGVAVQIIGAFISQFGIRHPRDGGTHRNSSFADGTVFAHYLNDDSTLRLFASLYRLASSGCKVIWPTTHSWTGATRFDHRGLEVWDPKLQRYVRRITLPSWMGDATMAFIMEKDYRTRQRHAVVSCQGRVLWQSPDPNVTPAVDIVIHPA